MLTSKYAANRGWYQLHEGSPPCQMGQAEALCRWEGQALPGFSFKQELLPPARPTWTLSFPPPLSEGEEGEAQAPGVLFVMTGRAFRDPGLSSAWRSRRLTGC